MYNAEKLLDDAIEIVKKIIGTDGMLEIKHPVVVKPTTSKGGSCKYAIGTTKYRALGPCTISLSEYILKDEIPYEKVMEVVIHEVLHAHEHGNSHTGIWKMHANKITAETPYKITRCMNGKEYGIERKRRETKYIVRCPHCGQTIVRTKMSKVVQHPEWYKCGICYHKLERVV